MPVKIIDRHSFVSISKNFKTEICCDLTLLKLLKGVLMKCIMARSIFEIIYSVAAACRCRRRCIY